MRSLIPLIGLWLLTGAAGAAAAAPEPVRVAVIEERSGTPALGALHAEEGFRLGLDYATHGTVTVHGRPILLAAIEGRGEADAASLLIAAFGNGKADLAVAIGSSEAALAMLPVTATFKRILLVAQAPASALTGEKRSRYVFRTAASADQWALAEVLALARPELNFFVAAQDTLDGRDAVDALKAAWRRHANGAFLIGSRLVPPRTADFGDAVSAEYEALHDLHGAKTLLTAWNAPDPPTRALAATDPGRLGIRLALANDLDPNAPPPEAALDGVASYFDGMPRNRVNDWLISAWRHRYRERPDGAAAEGMTAALALVAALRAAPSAETEALVATMEGLRFETPKGEMIFRKEDHQALQAMYQFRTEPRPVSGAAPRPPELVHAFTIPEIAP